MKPFLVFTCVFTFSLALEYNFDLAPLGQPSSIRLNKRLSSPSQQHGRSNVQQSEKKDIDINVQKESFQTERKRSEKRPDGIASTHSRSSTQGNNHQKCYYDMNVTVIIKTNKSLSAGAKFVKYVQAENSMECARKCCDISNCNQAIFENKDDYSCYLFDCGEPSVCVFAPHKSYISMSFAQKKHHSLEDSSHHQESKHENELAGLDKQNPLAASGGFPSSSSSASSLPKTTSTTTSTTLTPPISLSTTLRTTTQRKPKIVSLNDDCTSVDKCEDNHAECVQEKCTCQSGYYIKYGICRRQCDKHHFECDKKTDFKNGLDCIELQHVCDGIPQCADSSDEEGCSPDAFEDGPDSDVPYQIDDASSNQDPIEKEMPNVVTKLKSPSSPAPRHTESSNMKLKQLGELAKAKYNVKSLIEKDNPTLQSENLEKNKNHAPPDDRLATKKSPGQNYPIRNPDVRKNENWMKKTQLQKFHHNNELDRPRNVPPRRNTIDVQPFLRETSRIAEQPDNSGPPVWHHLGSYPQYQKQGRVSNQEDDPEAIHSSLQQQRQHEEQLLQQQQQRQQQLQSQNLGQGRVSNYEESNHQRVPLLDPQVALSQPKLYNEEGQPLMSKNYVLNNQGQNQQLQTGPIYQPSNPNYIQNQYLQETGHLSPKQQQQQMSSARKFAYHGNNYGYRQKVAAYRNNGYPLAQQQQQQAYQQVSGTYRDPLSNSYASNSGQASNWVDYPTDYLYTDQNPDDTNIGANAVQGYQYQPANLQNKPLSHNLGKDIHISETQLSNGGIPKIRPTKTHGHYQATGNGPKGSFHQYATGSNPNVYGDQSASMKVGIHQQPSSGMHTESKMHIVDEEQDTESAKTEDTPQKSKEDGKENPAVADAHNGTSVPINNQKSDTPAPTPTTTTKATPSLVNGPISGVQNITSSQTETGLAKFLQQSNYILKEKVVVASPTDNAQGPIVALALGLSFTTMLLIFVGCRLRRVKRRLRKGRALHSNEADYLVNGMYL